MKCKDCLACHRSTYTRWNPQKQCMQDVEIYECFGVKEPFEIYDVNKECSEYPEKRNEITGCSICGADYKNEIKCYSIKLHRCDDVLINYIPIKFCPNCGRKL